MSSRGIQIMANSFEVIIDVVRLMMYMYIIACCQKYLRKP